MIFMQYLFMAETIVCFSVFLLSGLQVLMGPNVISAGLFVIYVYVKWSEFGLGYVLSAAH